MSKKIAYKITRIGPKHHWRDEKTGTLKTAAKVGAETDIVHLTEEQAAKLNHLGLVPVTAIEAAKGSHGDSPDATADHVQVPDELDDLTRPKLLALARRVTGESQSGKTDTELRELLKEKKGEGQADANN